MLKFARLICAILILTLSLDQSIGAPYGTELSEGSMEFSHLNREVHTLEKRHQDKEEKSNVEGCKPDEKSENPSRATNESHDSHENHDSHHDRRDEVKSSTKKCDESHDHSVHDQAEPHTEEDHSKDGEQSSHKSAMMEKRDNSNPAMVKNAPGHEAEKSHNEETEKHDSKLHDQSLEKVNDQAPETKDGAGKGKADDKHEHASTSDPKEQEKEKKNPFEGKLETGKEQDHNETDAHATTTGPSTCEAKSDHSPSKEKDHEKTNNKDMKSGAGMMKRNVEKDEQEKKSDVLKPDGKTLQPIGEKKKVEENKTEQDNKKIDEAKSCAENESTTKTETHDHGKTEDKHDANPDSHTPHQ